MYFDVQYRNGPMEDDVLVQLDVDVEWCVKHRCDEKVPACDVGVDLFTGHLLEDEDE